MSLLNERTRAAAELVVWHATYRSPRRGATSTLHGPGFERRVRR